MPLSLTNADIIARLKSSRDAGLTFEAAKQKLLEAGVPEAQITEVTGDFDYSPYARLRPPL